MQSCSAWYRTHGGRYLATLVTSYTRQPNNREGELLRLKQLLEDLTIIRIGRIEKTFLIVRRIAKALMIIITLKTFKIIKM